MSYKIYYEQRATYLYARITGANRPETVVSYLRDLVDKCTEIGCFSILIHECLDGARLTAMELFNAISEGSTRVRGRFDAIAYVDEKMGDLMDFGEDVAVNRGLPLAAFNDLRSATRWILARNEDADGENIFRGSFE